jgi:glycosyltransferase involved in cell wall biosynthesis
MGATLPERVGERFATPIGWRFVRVLIFHGYLLDGTGSNVYNARLAAALVSLGHEVHLLSQDRHAEQQPFVDAVADWDSGVLRIEQLAREGGRREQRPGAGGCTVYRPDIGDLLPVYVADRYEGIEARTFSQCCDDEVAAYIDANVAAVGELLERVRPQLALANHLVMGPVILARGLNGAIPYAVKVHGSALEYTVKSQPDRFLELAREGLAGATGVLVGSHHTAASLWQAIGDDELPQRTRLGPPGVDVERFAPRGPEAAARGLRQLATELRRQADDAEPQQGGQEASAFTRDGLAAAGALARLDPDRDQLVVYVGKLIVSKGVDLLLAAWPRVLEQIPHARLVVVGFGAYRDGLERLCGALAAGDIEQARAIARLGRALEGQHEDAQHEEAQPLRHLLAFLDGLRGDELDRFLASARNLDEQIVFVGRLGHEELSELLPACEAAVVPSTFPEAFGMVAAEAAACGVLPLSAAHSGLAEVSHALARALPEQAVDWLSFPVDDHAVRAIATALAGWLEAEPTLKARTRAGLVATVRERWSWQGVANGVIAAASGDLEALAHP